MEQQQTCHLSVHQYSAGGDDIRELLETFSEEEDSGDNRC